MPRKYTKPSATATIAATTDIMIGAFVCVFPSVVPAPAPVGTSPTISPVGVGNVVTVSGIIVVSVIGIVVAVAFFFVAPPPPPPLLLELELLAIVVVAVPGWPPAHVENSQ